MNPTARSDLISSKLHLSHYTMSKPYVTRLLKRLVTSALGPTTEYMKVASQGAEVWDEKVFSSDPNHPNSNVAAMSWAVGNEASAMSDPIGLQTHPNEAQLVWLGASPAGLISGPGDELVCGLSEGILAVKCHFNKGRPELGLPWPSIPYYTCPSYWVDLYCWTPNGSTLFRVVTDREYWDLIYGILKEFWLEHVMPAREALLASDDEVAARRYMPLAKHVRTNNVIAQSRLLAAEGRLLCKDIGGQVKFFR
ncbi:hypothetical protein AMTRI_Chr07g28580 [Amborella trichopoda]